ILHTQRKGEKGSNDRIAASSGDLFSANCRLRGSRMCFTITYPKWPTPRCSMRTLRWLSAILFGTYLTLTGNSVALAAQQPSQIGQWSQPIPMPIVPIHVSLLPDGKVLLWR